MCGIVGYNGKNNCVDFLLDGLSKLEYRGYDLAGIALISNNQLQIVKEIVKEKGKLKNLKNKINMLDLNGDCAIGHTRWAAHGETSEKNASFNEAFYIFIFLYSLLLILYIIFFSLKFSSKDKFIVYINSSIVFSLLKLF